jgi:hypothetical protein
MLTIFTIPKPFLGHISIIQKNAINSWLQIEPKCEIILFGNDDGVAETAQELNVKHIPFIEKNEFGTPLISAAFTLAQQESKSRFLAYLNADIILLSDFTPSIKLVSDHFRETNFLIVGRRHDLDVVHLIEFNDDTWEETLKAQIQAYARLHRFSGIDYFVFPRVLRHEMPPFAVGRPRWDNWLIYSMRSKKIPVIDATEAITAVHQNHESIYRINGAESLRNFEQAGGYTKMCTILDANKLITIKGVVSPPLLRAVYATASLLFPGRILLAVKRRIQEFFCK